MIIKREMQSALIRLGKKLPVIGIVGPRQSGKTTLAKLAFDKHTYVSLEVPKDREFAQSDPERFLQFHHNNHGIILDEIQEVPSLLSYIQYAVDQNDKPGYFVLTGSQNFLVNEAITQTLAGRIALFTLLPLSIRELEDAEALPKTVEDVLFLGLYPRLYAAHLTPSEWFPFYIKTYVERDVRTLRNIPDLNLFQKFLGLCAGRIGQILNVTSLANDCGISVITARAWLSILEASYIIFLLQPYYKNFSKRLIKSPKLYFYDTGLACSLLNIESPKALASHYLRGGLFESLIITELAKWRYNQGLDPRLYFWRDKAGQEIDCIIERGETLIPVEMKASQTPNSSFFDSLTAWNELTQSKAHNNFVVYAGNENQKRTKGNLLSWKSVAAIYE